MKLQSASAHVADAGWPCSWLASRQCIASPELHHPQPACDEHSAQLLLWAAQKLPQLPGQVANELGGHADSAEPETPSVSHRPVVAQNPQPICAEQLSQVGNVEHATSTMASIGST